MEALLLKLRDTLLTSSSWEVLANGMADLVISAGGARLRGHAVDAEVEGPEELHTLIAEAFCLASEVDSEAAAFDPVGPLLHFPSPNSWLAVGYPEKGLTMDGFVLYAIFFVDDRIGLAVLRKGAEWRLVVTAYGNCFLSEQLVEDPGVN